LEGLKVIKAELGDFDEVEIYTIADTHIGDEFTNEQSIKEFIRYILERPNRFVILNGDIMDNALTVSVSDTYSQKYSPSQAIQYAARIFQPLVNDHRILAMGTGNHEGRTFRLTGIDISAFLAKELGIHDRYSDNSFILFVKFGKSIHWTQTRDKKNVYSIFSWHGAGGGRKPGGKMNRAQSMQETVDADLYIMSHVHTPMAMSECMFKVDNQNMTVSKHNKSFLISSCHQNYGGYGQTFGYAPASTEQSYAILSGNGRKHIRVVIGIK